MDNKNFKNELNNEFDVSKNDPAIILIKTKPVPYSDLVLRIIKSATDNGIGGVYLSSVYPHNYITDKLEKYDIDKKNLFWIDTVSWMADKPSETKGRCIFIKNPDNLEEVETWTRTLIDKIKTKNKFLFIDSVSNMLINNDIKALEKFMQSLVDYIDVNGLKKVIFLVGEGKEDGFYKTLTGLFEKKKLKIKEIRT